MLYVHVGKLLGELEVFEHWARGKGVGELKDWIERTERERGWKDKHGEGGKGKEVGTKKKKGKEVRRRAKELAERMVKERIRFLGGTLVGRSYL